MKVMHFSVTHILQKITVLLSVTEQRSLSERILTL